MSDRKWYQCYECGGDVPGFVPDPDWPASANFARCTDCQQRRMNAIRAAARAAEENAVSIDSWNRQLAELNASAEDYSESGFAKKMAQLMARKPVLNTKVT